MRLENGDVIKPGLQPGDLTRPPGKNRFNGFSRAAKP